MERIRVRVFRQGNRPFLTAEWVDPLTGKLRRKSTGQKQQREAERFAARLEKDLNEGRLSDYRTTWAEFRDRYGSEVLSFKSASSRAKASAAFNAVEKHIGPKMLRGFDAGQISKLSAVLRENGQAEASIASALRTLKAALRWAARLKLIPEAPHITMPTKATAKAGGRAVTGEEFERMLAAVPKALIPEPKKGKAVPAEAPEPPSAERVESWRFLLWGLWWSGLRIREAFRLHWTDDRELTIDQKAKRPMFRIKAGTDKGRKDRRFPMAKEFAQLLAEIPRDQQDGFVFNPQLASGRRAGFDKIVRTIVAIGEKAGIVVDHNTKGDPVTASAHDLRRAFGTRWAKRVMPPVLKQLMRHESIQTTMTFYVDQNADEAAEAAWEACSKTETAGSPITSTITAPAPSTVH